MVGYGGTFYSASKVAQLDARVEGLGDSALLGVLRYSLSANSRVPTLLRVAADW